MDAKSRSAIPGRPSSGRADPPARRGSRGGVSGDLIGAQEARTLPGLLQARLARSPNRRAYMAYDARRAAWRRFTWREVAARAGRFRLALQKLGLEKGDRVALLLPNGIDWVAFDMAALSLGLVVVPLHLRDGAFNQADVLTRSGARLILIDRLDRWARITASAERTLATEHVWLAEASDAALPQPVTALADVLPPTGAWVAEVEADADDVATLIYTSGTTGAPKGVMLTHRAILWNAEAVTKLIAPKSSDLFLSILPLAHAFERTVGYYLPMMAGATVAYARSVDLLGRDLVAVRPTIMLAVPRLYERAYAEMQRQVARWPFGTRLLDVAAELGWRRTQWERGRDRTPPVVERMAEPLLRRLVGGRLLAALGGRLRVAVTGGARLAEPVARSLVGLGVPLVEGYGLTEAGPVVTGSSIEDYLPGSAGAPVEGAQIRVSQEGELLVRSPGLMQGYWRDAQATAAALEDGWLKTGDAVEVRDGRVFVRGRLNDVVVLATGEKLDPEPVETAILSDPLFEQACVLGDARPFVVAVVVLAKECWRSLAGDLGVDPERPNASAAKAEILGRIERALKQFPSFAQVRGVHVAAERWSAEAGLLTPTLKVKRYAVASRYGREIADLYRPHLLFD